MPRRSDGVRGRHSSQSRSTSMNGAIVCPAHAGAAGSTARHAPDGRGIWLDRRVSPGRCLARRFGISGGGVRQGHLIRLAAAAFPGRFACLPRSFGLPPAGGRTCLFLDGADFGEVFEQSSLGAVLRARCPHPPPGFLTLQPGSCQDAACGRARRYTSSVVSSSSQTRARPRGS